LSPSGIALWHREQWSKPRQDIFCPLIVLELEIQAAEWIVIGRSCFYPVLAGDFQPMFSEIAAGCRPEISLLTKAVNGLIDQSRSPVWLIPVRGDIRGVLKTPAAR
jgi:hypothetical protein